MTVETHEDEARRVVMEINRRSVTVTAQLAKTTWVELRHFIGERLSSGNREPRVGQRVTTKELEQSTRGQRESVNLTDPRTAKLVEKELKRYGVTFAITRDDEGTRVHIGAGNATQLDTAMRRAEQTLARQIEARQARDDRRAEWANPTYEDAEGRRATEPGAREVRRDEPLSPAVDELHPTRTPTRTPTVAPPLTDARFTHVPHEALPAAMAQEVLADNGWPTLAKSLGDVVEVGLDPVTVLGSVVRERETFTSRSVAAVLAWRVDNAIHEAAPKLNQQTKDAAPERSQAAGRNPHEERTGPARSGGPGEVKDARAAARTALNERAKALPKNDAGKDLLDLATEKPTRGLDLGGPRR